MIELTGTVIWTQEHFTEEPDGKALHQARIYGVVEGHGCTIELASPSQKFELKQEVKVSIEAV